MADAEFPARGTKQYRAWMFFARGLAKTSKEVKALGITPSTRENYFTKYRLAGSPSAEEIEKAAAPANPRRGPAARLPGGEKVGPLQEKALTIQPENDEDDENGSVVEEGPISGISQEIEDEDEFQLGEEDVPGRSNGGHPEGNGKEGVEVPADGSKGKKLSVLAAGLTVTVQISVKTLTLYNIAATAEAEQNGGELTMGDFIDACVEDTYEGRGLYLGLIKQGREAAHAK